MDSVNLETIETSGSQVCLMCGNPINWYIIIRGKENKNTFKGLDGKSIKAESLVTGKYNGIKGKIMYKLEIIAQCPVCNAKNKFDYQIDR